MPVHDWMACKELPYFVCVNHPNIQHAVLFCNLGTSFICFRAQPQCKIIAAVGISKVPGLRKRIHCKKTQIHSKHDHNFGSD